MDRCHNDYCSQIQQSCYSYPAKHPIPFTRQASYPKNKSAEGRGDVLKAISLLVSPWWWGQAGTTFQWRAVPLPPHIHSLPLILLSTFTISFSCSQKTPSELMCLLTWFPCILTDTQAHDRPANSLSLTHTHTPKKSTQPPFFLCLKFNGGLHREAKRAVPCSTLS